MMNDYLVLYIYIYMHFTIIYLLCEMVMLCICLCLLVNSHSPLIDCMSSLTLEAFPGIERFTVEIEDLVPT
jgi:hypothetical protein